MGWQIRYQELTFILASPQTEKSQFLHQLMGKRQSHVKATWSFLCAGKTPNQHRQCLQLDHLLKDYLTIFLIPAKLNMHKFSIEIDWIVAVNIRTLI